MKVIFSEKAQEHLKYWQKHNPKIQQKIQTLLEAISQDPFKGIGKPEQLKYELTGLWSRRINREHRIVYSIVGDEIKIHSLRFHY